MANADLLYFVYMLHKKCGAPLQKL